MKKFLLSSVLLFCTFAFGQEFREVGDTPYVPTKNDTLREIRRKSKEINTPTSTGIGINYGTSAKSIGIEISSSKDGDVAFGGGVSISFNSPSYTGTEIDTPFSWFQKVKVETGPTWSFYGILGYQYSKFKAVGKIGMGWYTTVNTYKSTATNTYWYQIADTYSETLLGATLSYTIDKSWILDIGHDNFNGTTIGATYIFNYR